MNTDILIENLQQFKDELLKLSIEDANNNQELIFSVLKLITNPLFIESIFLLREKYNLQEKYMQGNDIEKWMTWMEMQKPTPPSNQFDQEIIDICNNFSVDSMIVGGFVGEYLHFGKITLSRPDSLEHLFFPNQHKYKCRMRYLEDDLHRPVLAIEIFSDTTPSMIQRFVADNQLAISKIQGDHNLLVSAYPYSKKSHHTKRDFLIYTLSKLGKTVKEISSEVVDHLEKEYADEPPLSLKENDQGTNPDEFVIRFSIKEIDRRLQE